MELLQIFCDLFYELLCLVFNDGGMGPGMLQSGAALCFFGEFGDYVEVDMWDDLACGLAVVGEDVVVGCADGLDDGFCESGEDASYCGGGFLGKFVDELVAYFGDDEGVAATGGVDVEKCEDVLIFVDFI